MRNLIYYSAALMFLHTVAKISETLDLARHIQHHRLGQLELVDFYGGGHPFWLQKQPNKL